MADEIEKKYLVTDSADIQKMVKSFKTTNITQAYLEVGDTERRVRSKGDKYFYTVKQKKSADGLIRAENEREISKEEFEQGLKEHIGNIIDKTRTKVPLGDDLYAELDIYKGELQGLLSVEVEFPNEEAVGKFQAPAWFGADVTADKRYKNQNLAMNGLPKQQQGSTKA